MSTEQRTIDFLLEQLASLPGISARKMFGEFAIYYEAKVVALVCDDRLFVKATAAGRALLGDATEAPPYPGARPHIVIEDVDDAETLVAVLQATARELLIPRLRRVKRPKVSR